ncbi:MAG TPA: response regulator [Deltaproteobacteria bacterium]|nr:response regulator [Deltaproteobacteria bacterium]HPR53607.1 response regulator [Deltaproteobacteria bacterium]HXK47122.1 response regulator [Deltaproteobacteria bacterium]
MSVLREFDDSFFEDLFVNSTAISAVTDENGILQKVNTRAMEMFFGTENDTGSVLGRNILEFIHVEDRPKVIERWKESLEGKKEVKYDLRMTGADGHVMYFLISGRPILRDDRVVLFHYQALDIIDQKVQEQNLMASAGAEILAQIAGGFAHDFNNLLTVINGYSEILKMSMDKSDALYHKVSQICEAGRQASVLTRRMLEFSRKTKTEARLVDLNAEIFNQEGIIKHVIGENISVGFSKSPGIGKVLIEPAHLATLLVNLTINAKDAMSKGGEITISTEPLDVNGANEHLYAQVPHGSYILLTFKDTGEGMTEEVRRQIFDPFFSTRDGGKGIGLWTVQNIVHTANGHIFVESDQEFGTTFSILFPSSTAEIKGLPHGDKDVEPVHEPAGKKTILVVEDDDTVRDLVNEVLKQQGHVTLTARNGGDALQIARQFEGHIDLLITDMVMRRIDGRMLARKMKSIWPHVKVMFMSGYGGEILDEDELKGSVFLQKPFLPKDLIDKVMAVFR